MKFEATDYAPAFSTVAVADKQTSTTQGQLSKVGATATFAANTASTVAVPGSTARVALAADTIVNAATGAAPSGAVTVKITPIDPASNPQSMPGDYTSLTSAGAVQSIESFGALNVELKDAAGNKLNLAQGKSATIRIAVSSRTAAAGNPATIPLYYFNESNGRWVQEGTATLSADKQYYEGTVTHFSTWNCDRPIEETIYVNGCVVDTAGKPVSNTYAVESEGIDYTGSAYARTDVDGKFRVAMKKNGIATVSMENNVGPGLYRQTGRVKVGPSPVDITLPSCLVLSDPAYKPPVILYAPKDVSVLFGSDAYFNIYVDCYGPKRYQWYRNDVAIVNAIGSNLILNNATMADNASTYKVVVSCLSDTVTSTPVTLTVFGAPVAPTITTQPVNETVTQNQTARFSVVAKGTPDPTYQWLRDGKPIPGATSSMYIIPAVDNTYNSAQYSVTVTNAGGSVTSTAATLTVVAATPPAVITQPTNSTVNIGQNAIFSVNASGTGPLTYQWYRNGTAIAGASGSIYVTPLAIAADSGTQFTVKITNSGGSVTSNPATLTVGAISMADINALAVLMALPGGFESNGSDFYGGNHIARPALSVCSSGSYTATLDGSPILPGSTEPSGQHTIAGTFTNCVEAQTKYTGSYSRTYNVDSTFLNGSGVFTTTNMREISTVTGAPRDVTINGQVSGSFTGQIVGNVKTEESTYTAVPGSTVKNNLTNNTATHVSGSISTRNVGDLSGSIQGIQLARVNYNAATYTIGAKKFEVSGYYNLEPVAGVLKATGEIIVKADGVQVGRQYFDAAGNVRYEINSPPPLFVLPPSSPKLFGRFGPKF